MLGSCAFHRISRLQSLQGRVLSSVVGKNDSVEGLTHLRRTKDSVVLPRMVDVSSKENTLRVATAMGKVEIPKNVAEKIRQTQSASDKVEILGKKGPIIATSIVAGVMAVKKTHDLIPFCHAIPIEGCDISVEWEKGSEERNVLEIFCTVKTSGKTGVEMEALVGVSNTALCIYDMLKALSHDIRIFDIQLESKRGGKSDFKRST